MLRNIANDFEMLNSEYAILTALSNMRPRPFKVIHARAHMSSRTVSKHLGNLVHRHLISKDGRAYRMTPTGVEYLTRLVHRLEEFRQYRMRMASLSAMQLVREEVEAVCITPFGDCRGLVHVSVPRRLNPQEREDIGGALTKAIYVIVDSVPSDSKEYDVAITGISKSRFLRPSNLTELTKGKNPKSGREET